MGENSKSLTRSRIELWVATLLSPVILASGYASLFFIAPVWGFPFGTLLYMILSGYGIYWVMFMLPVIVAAIILDLGMRDIGRPAISKITIPLFALIIIILAVLNDIIVILLSSSGTYWGAGIIPIPIVSVVQYNIFKQTIEARQKSEIKIPESN
ncbi:MAG: hypothetical protein ACFFF4_09700 [Candidatus Thorarchaeota archaeon]